MKNQFKTKTNVQTVPCIIKVETITSENVTTAPISNLDVQKHVSDTLRLASSKMQMYTINSANQNAYWDGSKWVLTEITDFTPVAMTFDLEGRQWLIDRSGIVGFVDEKNSQVISKGKLGGWRLKELHFDLNGNKYCISTDYKIGFWPANGEKWEDISNGIKAQSISLSNNGVLWCLDTQYRVTQWDHQQHRWSKRSLLGGRMLTQITFGTKDELYCVTADQQISVRNIATSQWQDLGSLSRWGVLFIAFKRPVSVTNVAYDLTKSNINLFEETASKENVFNKSNKKKIECEYTHKAKNCYSFCWKRQRSDLARLKGAVKVPLYINGTLELNASREMQFGLSFPNYVATRLYKLHIAHLSTRTAGQISFVLQRASLRIPFSATISNGFTEVVEDGELVATYYYAITSKQSNQLKNESYL